MRYIYFFSLIILFFAESLFAQIPSDLSVAGFKGKVKTVSLDSAKFNQEINDSKEEKRETFQQWEYDEKGFYILLSDTKYNSRKYSIKYDNQGRIIEKTESGSGEKSVYVYKKDSIEQLTQTNNGLILDKWVYTFDEKGNKIKSEYVLINKDLGQRLLDPPAKTIYKYDLRGNLIESVYFNSDESPTGILPSFHKFVNIYDEKNNRIETSIFNTKSKLTFKWSYKFDEKNNLIESVRSTNSPNLIHNYSDFDEFGNWTKDKISNITVKDGKTTIQPTEIVYRKISYYQ